MTWLSAVLREYVTRLVPKSHAPFLRDMPHTYVTRRVHVWHDSLYFCTSTWHVSLLCDMPYSYVTWLISTWHDSIIMTWSMVVLREYVTRLIPKWHALFLRDIFLFESRSNWFFCLNLVRTEILLFREIFLFPRDFAVLRFEQENLRVSFPKEAPKSCPWPERLPFKSSISLQHLVGPSHLELPF